MRRRSNRLALAGMILLALADPGRVARGQAIGPGFELERAGRYADAASVYFTTVRSDPTNIPALLGLERTLFVLNRMPELLPLVQNARARQPESHALRSLELRVYAALNEPDSLEAIARRWAASVPQSEAPYREWGLALADRRMWDEARRAFLTGRQTLGGDSPPQRGRRWSRHWSPRTATHRARCDGSPISRARSRRPRAIASAASRWRGGLI